MFTKISAALFLALPLALSACSSAPQVKQQNYAKLSDHRVFENDFPTVWKAIDETFRNYKVTRNPEDVGVLEMRKLNERTLQTDWIFGQSRDKYIEYQVNGSPRKQYLQSKIRFTVTAKAQIGGVMVKVKTEEEIERLDKMGNPQGFDTVNNIDPARAAEILDKINTSINSLPPI